MPPTGMLHVRQRAEAHREGVLALDFLRRHVVEFVPSHAGPELHAHALLHGFALA
jgi:hypothetical protein